MHVAWHDLRHRTRHIRLDLSGRIRNRPSVVVLDKIRVVDDVEIRCSRLIRIVSSHSSELVLDLMQPVAKCLGIQSGRYENRGVEEVRCVRGSNRLALITGAHRTDRDIRLTAELPDGFG